MSDWIVLVPSGALNVMMIHNEFLNLYSLLQSAAIVSHTTQQSALVSIKKNIELYNVKLREGVQKKLLF